MDVRQATIRFYGDLRDLAWQLDRAGETQVPVEVRRSVKDAIESCGVPHTEVDLVLVNGESVGFGHPIGEHDRVSAYPPFQTLAVDRVSKVRPPPPPEPRFVLDVHLGRLTERLRQLGLDSRYHNDATDDELAAVSAAEQRWLLTRDRELLMRAAVVHGYYVRAVDPTRQTVEVLRRFGLADELAPLTRCARCNGVLERVDKADVADRLEPATRAEHDEFARCTACGRLYWAGSHQPSLRSFIDSVRAAASG